MIKLLRHNILFVVFVLITFSSVGQDILHLRKGGEKRIIFDAVKANSLTYRDYDDPDFKLVTERKKLYSKVVLANGKTIWLTQRDSYFRFRLGMNIGGVSPIGDFASTDSSNTNAGYGSTGMQFSATIDVNIYKFVGFRAMGYSTSGFGNEYIGYWDDYGFALGPEFHIKLSPRFYALIPVLFQYKRMTSETYSSSSNFYSSVTGDGNGTGFITGLGLHARMHQYMAIGLTCQYFQQNMAMNYNQNNGYNLPSTSYQVDNKWSYLSTAVTFTVHF